jgi:Ni,Fe-hydrogenase I cytochrome b subunit
MHYSSVAIKQIDASPLHDQCDNLITITPFTTYQPLSFSCHIFYVYFICPVIIVGFKMSLETKNNEFQAILDCIVVWLVWAVL